MTIGKPRRDLDGGLTWPPEMLPRCPGAEVIVVDGGEVYRACETGGGEIDLERVDRNTKRDLH